MILRRLARVFVFDWCDGFDIGLIVGRWRRYGPFLFYREMLTISGPVHIGPWRFAVFFTRRAWREFYEGSTK